MESLVITAICAIIISIISIISTIIFSYLQRQHNINSVRPLCEIILSDYENKIAVTIANVGTGSMIITDCMCKDTKDDNRKSKILYELMPDIRQPYAVDYDWTDYDEHVIGRAIPVNGEIVLIELDPPDGQDRINEYIQNKVRRALMTLTIDVTYTDVYGSIKFEKSGHKDPNCCTKFEKHRDLTFFGRNLDEETTVTQNNNSPCKTNRNPSRKTKKRGIAH